MVQIYVWHNQILLSKARQAYALIWLAIFPNTFYNIQFVNSVNKQLLCKCNSKVLS